MYVIVPIFGIVTFVVPIMACKEESAVFVAFASFAALQNVFQMYMGNKIAYLCCL